MKLDKITKPESSKLYNYVCQVLDWLDGDTLKVKIDLGFDIEANKHVRVFGINAREIHSKDIEERKAGVKARTFAQMLAPVSSYILVKTHQGNREQEKFGRWLADITLRDGRNFSDVMIEERHAVPYFGGKR